LIEQLEAVGVGKFLSRPVPVPTSQGNWMRYEFASSQEGPTCLFGSPYQVFVRPGKNDKVLFYLEGGGGCWNEATCFGESDLGAKLTSDPIAPLDALQGILATDSPTNPFDGWNVVYVPYCDGSVFSGDNVVTYPSGTVYHRGQANLSAGVDVMRDLFPDPSEIVVSGSSAGGFGTFTGYGVVRVAYPDEKLFVLNDAGPGVQNNDDQQAVMERRENWNFEQFVVKGCTGCSEQPAFLLDWVIDNDPNVTTALFSYLDDFVISDFLSLDPSDYRALLLDVSGQIHDRHPARFKRYLVPGATHTALLGFGIGPDGLVLGFNTLKVDGIGVPAWIADFLTDGPDWRDLVDEGDGNRLEVPGS